MTETYEKNSYFLVDCVFVCTAVVSIQLLLSGFPSNYGFFRKHEHIDLNSIKRAGFQSCWSTDWHRLFFRCCCCCCYCGLSFFACSCSVSQSVSRSLIRVKSGWIAITINFLSSAGQKQTRSFFSSSFRRQVWLIRLWLSNKKDQSMDERTNGRTNGRTDRQICICCLY